MEAVEGFFFLFVFCFFVGFVFGSTGSRVGHFCANKPRKSHSRSNEVTIVLTDTLSRSLGSLLHMDPALPHQGPCPVDQHMPLLGMTFGQVEISCLVPSMWRALFCAEIILLLVLGLLAVPFCPQHLQAAAVLSIP